MSQNLTICKSYFIYSFKFFIFVQSDKLHLKKKFLSKWHNKLADKKKIKYIKKALEAKRKHEVSMPSGRLRQKLKGIETFHLENMKVLSFSYFLLFK